ncbi:MAG: prephenate dehydratase [Thermodesulfobacteriota bacterium]
MQATSSPETLVQPDEADWPQQALTQARQKIDEIDRSLRELLNQRAQQAKVVAQCKSAGDQPLFVPEREAQVLEGLCQDNGGPLAGESLRHIFREIISACRQVQQPLRVAFLGPEHTFSHQAALSHFGRSCQYAPQESIAEVFAEVEADRCPLGVVPVENSSQGGVNETLDMLMTMRLSVCGEIYARVGHVLMSREAELAYVTHVHSHPQALHQCRGWLRRRLPQAELREASSTAAAARLAAQEPGGAAVGSALTAQHYQLNVLAADIQDSPLNSTRFLILGRRPCPPSGQDKTSLFFGLDHRPGALCRTLGHLARRGVNLTHIQSRPIKDRPWEYAFFVDCLGHHQDGRLGQALAAMRPEVEFLKVLGSYPRGQALPGM